MIYDIGYTAGVFDLFHVGHLNILRAAKSLCNKLIVGVTTDEACKYKNKTCVIPHDQRIQIVQNIKFVDTVVPQNDVDKIIAYKKLHFDALFVGDDWFGSDSWNRYEKYLTSVNVPIIYLPYTSDISTTKLISKIYNKLD
jgi:glycerol-3-phosphate cytidylyltransferase